MLLRKFGYVCSRAGGSRLSQASVRRCGLGGTELSERELRHHEVPSRVAPERLELGEAAQPMGSNWTRARSGSGRWPRACRRASGSGIGVGWIGKRVAASCCSRTRAITRGARDVWSGGKNTQGGSRTRSGSSVRIGIESSRWRAMCSNTGANRASHPVCVRAAGSRRAAACISCGSWWKRRGRSCTSAR